MQEFSNMQILPKFLRIPYALAHTGKQGDGVVGVVDLSVSMGDGLEQFKTLSS